MKHRIQNCVTLRVSSLTFIIRGVCPCSLYWSPHRYGRSWRLAVIAFLPVPRSYNVTFVSVLVHSKDAGKNEIRLFISISCTWEKAFIEIPEVHMWNGANEESGADPAGKLKGGGAISVIFGVKFHYGLTTVRGMKYTSQHCCDKRDLMVW